MKFKWVGALVILVFLVACSGASPTPSSIQLGNGAYTPLGGVQKNDHPTASDFADLQSAASGALGIPAFVEFYADY